MLFYPQQKDNYSEIIQVDKNGTAWIKNSINFNAEDGVTYVWKINKFGKVISLYRFASDAEDYGTIWPVKHNIIISNDGLVYWMTSNKEQLKFRKLKAFSFQEMQALANKLDRKLIHKKKANTNIHEKRPSKLTLEERAHSDILMSSF